MSQTDRKMNHVQSVELPPKNIMELAGRAIIDERNSKIKEPHCRICGDTEADGLLVKITTQVSTFSLCEVCFECQESM